MSRRPCYRACLAAQDAYLEHSSFWVITRIRAKINLRARYLLMGPTFP